MLAVTRAIPSASVCAEVMGHIAQEELTRTVALEIGSLVAVSITWNISGAE